jgi:hypothetical protein
LQKVKDEEKRMHMNWADGLETSYLWQPTASHKRCFSWILP